jgi:nitroreductase
MIEELMRSRRSIRSFKKDALSRERVEELIEIAITAPSASNKQPWRFFVTDDRALIDAMADAVRDATERIAAHIPEESIGTFRNYGDYFVRFRAAPVVIVTVFRELLVLSNLVDDELGSDDRAQIRQMEFNSGLASTAMAMQNLLLYAHALELGASCMTGPMIAMDRIKTLMGIPNSWCIAGVIPVGYPDEQPTPPTRKSVDAVIRWVGQEGNK